MDEMLVPMIESVIFSFLNSYGVGNDPFEAVFFFLFSMAYALVYCFYFFLMRSDFVAMIFLVLKTTNMPARMLLYGAFIGNCPNKIWPTLR